MKNFKFNKTEKLVEVSDENLTFKKLYAYLKKEKISFNGNSLRKNFRKLKYTNNLVAMCLNSGFYEDNKNKTKFEPHKDKFDAFLKANK